MIASSNATYDGGDEKTPASFGTCYNSDFTYNEDLTVFEHKHDDYFKDLLFNNRSSLECFDINNYPPEYIDINSLMPQPLGEEQINMINENVKEVDVEFVRDWKVDNPDSLKPTRKKKVAIKEENKDTVSRDTELLSDKVDALPSVPKKRKTTEQKPNNSVRKMQLKNAKVGFANADLKNIRRESQRNCGAIYCPPDPLTEKDYREWPVDGMHQQPFYDPASGTVISYHFPSTKAKVTETTLEEPIH